MHSIVNQHNLNQMDELMCTQMHTCSRNYHLCFQYQLLTTQNKNYWINGQGWLLQLMDGVNLLLWSKVIYKRYGKPIQKYQYRLYKSTHWFVVGCKILCISYYLYLFVRSYTKVITPIKLNIYIWTFLMNQIPKTNKNTQHQVGWVYLCVCVRVFAED